MGKDLRTDDLLDNIEQSRTGPDGKHTGRLVVLALTNVPQRLGSLRFGIGIDQG